MKPQDFEALLGEIGSKVAAEQTVLSVAAAVTTEQIERHLSNGVPVLRAMPNAPATVHEGVAGLCAGAHANNGHLAEAQEVLEHVGRVVQVPEPYMDAVTAVSGSGPAYFALLAEAMIEAGILLGLSREVSTDLVVQTMFGTAKLLRDEEMHPVELREMVTSPGGTTIRAIRAGAGSVRAAFLNAIQAAMERSKNSGKPTRPEESSTPPKRTAQRWSSRRRCPRRRGHRALRRLRPGPAHELAAELEADWSSATLWWGDERCVPRTTSSRTIDSRARRWIGSLCRHGPCTASAASSAANRLPTSTTACWRRLLGLAFQGIGPDGHTAPLPRLPGTGRAQAPRGGRPA